MVFLHTGVETGAKTLGTIVAFPFIILFGLIFFAIAVLVFIFWIFMILDCARRKFKKENDKIIWILVVVLLHWLGALIYYFAVRQKYGKAK